MTQRKKKAIQITLSPLKIFPNLFVFIVLLYALLLLLDVTFCSTVIAIESYYYAFRAQSLNCSPRSSMFLKRSKLAQQGLKRMVSPSTARFLHSFMHSSIL